MNYKQWNLIRNIKQQIMIPNNYQYVSQYETFIYEYIFMHYHNFAFTHAYRFKQSQFFKCKKIPMSEVNLWAQTGLLKAILKYDFSQSTKFSNYASKYIEGELYTGLTQQFPISTISKNNRRKKNEVKKDVNLYDKHYYLLKSSNEHTYEETHRYDEMWEKIQLLDPKVQRIFRLKFDAKFNVIRSNAHIGELMCYSEENIRKILKKYILLIT